MSEGDGVSRNFRTAYYGKLGFCGNDEKKYLDSIIASSPSLNIEKLNDLCEKFELDRKSLDAWRVYLGVDCARRNPFDEYANVRRVRTEHFQSLRHHLEVLLKHNTLIKSRLMKNDNKEGSQIRKSIGREHRTSNTLLGNNHMTNEDDANQHSQNLPPQEQNHFMEEDASLDCTQNAKTIDGQQQHDCLQNLGTKTGEQEETENGQIQNCHPPNLDRSSDEVNDVSGHIDKKRTANKARDDTLLVEDLESKPDKLITLMYLLEAGKLKTSHIDEQLNSDYCRRLSTMANFFVHVSKDLQEAFFLFREVSKVVSS